MNKKIVGLAFALLVSGFLPDTQAMAGRLRAAVGQCAQTAKNVSKKALWNTAAVGSFVATVAAISAYCQYKNAMPLIEKKYEEDYILGQYESGPLIQNIKQACRACHIHSIVFPAQQLIIDRVTEICKAHGIEHSAILGDIKTPYPNMCVVRYGEKIILQISKPFIDAWSEQLRLFGPLTVERFTSVLFGTVKPLTIEQLEAVLIHEIGHYKNDDTKIRCFLQCGLLTEDTRTHTAASCGLGVTVAAIKTLSQALPRAGKTVFVASCLLGAATFRGTEKIINFSPLSYAVERELEYGADRYVVATAVKNNDPQLLDNFADYFEYLVKKFDPHNCTPVTTHPPVLERIAIVRKAAQELRDGLSPEKNEEHPEPLIEF